MWEMPYPHGVSNSVVADSADCSLTTQVEDDMSFA